MPTQSKSVPATQLSVAMQRYATLPLHAIAGRGFIQHGWAMMIKGPDAFAAILRSLHIPFPHLSAYLTISVEPLGGAALLLGAVIARAWEALKASKGSVAFMSGSAALDPKPAFAAVAATNAAIPAMAKAFAEQGIREGVQVNSIIPGAVMTGRRRSFLEKWAPAHNMTIEEATMRFPEEAGISRYGKPEEIAESMAFLVSPGAKWMTGTSVRMDGGEIRGI
jgi:NAD(P)-dependent dehydrogenase (short-subunit alcohol dehydrogenase family)